MSFGGLVQWVRDWLTLVVTGIPALWRLRRLYSNRTPQQRKAQRRIHELRQAGSAPTDGEGRILRALRRDVYEIAVDELTGEATPSAEQALTVVHLLGSGETRFTPLPGLRLLLERRPELGRYRHLVVDTPYQAAAFLSAEAFVARILQNLRGELPPAPAPVLLMGLSRGALAATEIACRLAIDQARPAAALALSPPARADYTWPATVLDIGALLPSTEAVSDLRWFPRAYWRFVQKRMLVLFLDFSSWVMAELSFADDDNLASQVREASQRRPVELCLRAVREYELLTRVPDTELRHAYTAFAQRIAGCGHLRVVFCWGDRDPWVPCGPARQRVDSILARCGVPDKRGQTRILSGWNHPIGRQLDQDFGPLADQAMELTQWLCRLRTPPEVIQEQDDVEHD